MVLLQCQSGSGCHGAVYKHFSLPLAFLPLKRRGWWGGEDNRFTIEPTLLCLEANALSTELEERGGEKEGEKTHNKNQSESVLRRGKERVVLRQKTCSRGRNQLKWTFKLCRMVRVTSVRGRGTAVALASDEPRGPTTAVKSAAIMADWCEMSSCGGASALNSLLCGVCLVCRQIFIAYGRRSNFGSIHLYAKGVFHNGHCYQAD